MKVQGRDRNHKKDQKEILQLESTITEMKYSAEGFNSRHEHTQGVSAAEGKIIETIQSERKKE